MSAQPFFVDSYAPLTEEAIAYLLKVSGGVLPLCCGRYIDADLMHDIEIAAKYGIPLLLIARRSARVPLGEDAGSADGSTDWARVKHWLSVAVAKGAAVLRSVFLDVEMEPTMSAAYWRGWSAAFVGTEFDPCAYMPNRDFWPASWVSLEAAVAGGSRCGGTWVALYHQKADGSAVLCEEGWDKHPKGSMKVPYLAWQRVGNAYQQRYDFSLANPDASEWIADTLPAAPNTIRSPEIPRAESVTAPLQLSVLDAVSDYEEET